MGNKVIICGLNGVGKSTLGKNLAKALDYKFLDIENYYFPKNNTDYYYCNALTRDEVQTSLLNDLKKYDNLILASVKGNYCDEVEALLTKVIYIQVPKDVRMKRVWNRSYNKFGVRILPDGDLYEKEKSFFNMVEKRSEKDVEDWLLNIRVPVIRVNGIKSIEDNTAGLVQILNKD